VMDSFELMLIARIKRWSGCARDYFLEGMMDDYRRCMNYINEDNTIMEEYKAWVEYQRWMTEEGLRQIEELAHDHQPCNFSNQWR
jgi:hypothetical protein